MWYQRIRTDAVESVKQPRERQCARVVFLLAILSEERIDVLDHNNRVLRHLSIVHDQSTS